MRGLASMVLLLSLAVSINSQIGKGMGPKKQRVVINSLTPCDDKKNLIKLIKTKFTRKGYKTTIKGTAEYLEDISSKRKSIGLIEAFKDNGGKLNKVTEFTRDMFEEIKNKNKYIMPILDALKMNASDPFHKGTYNYTYVVDIVNDNNVGVPNGPYVVKLTWYYLDDKTTIACYFIKVDVVTER